MEEKRWWIHTATELWHPFLEIMTPLHRNYDTPAESVKLKLLTPPFRSSYHPLPISWLPGYHNTTWRKKWWIYEETELWYPFLEIMTLHKNYDTLAKSAKLKLLSPSFRSSYHPLSISWLPRCHNTT